MQIKPFRLETKDISLILYLLSLPFPALYLDHDYIALRDNVYSSLYVLIWGIFSLPDGTVAWFANPFFIIAYLGRNIKSSVVFSILATISALSSFFYSSIWNDGDGRIQIVGYGSGFYIWLASIVLLTASNLNNYQRNTPNRQK